MALIALAFVSVAAAIAPVTLTSSSDYYSWYGKDGNWSAISVKIGTPPQWVQLIPSTESTELLTVLSLACQDSNCEKERGGLFNDAKSSSWSEIGHFDFFSDTRQQKQGLNLTAKYGTDTIIIQDSLTIEEHVLAGFADNSLYDAGVFGLAPENITLDGEREYDSLLGSLFKAKKIPSLSYSYTAGAYHRKSIKTLIRSNKEGEKQVLCQVILGGYDLTRFTPHGISFSLNPSLKPIANLQSLAIGDENVADPVDVYIDSTTPYLWLPESICDKAASKLGLTWNETVELYFYDDYEATKDANFTFHFDLAQSADSDESVSLDLPFAAFDLWHGETRYFPLKRSRDKLQYTLGRAFLQETYLIVDFNRVNFTIAQAVFDGNTGSTQDVRTISNVLELPEEIVSHRTNNKVPVAAIVGATVGGVVLLLFVVATIIFLFRRKKKQPESYPAPTFPGGPDEFATPSCCTSPVEIDDASPKIELPGTPGYVTPTNLGPMEKVELDATGGNNRRNLSGRRHRESVHSYPTVSSDRTSSGEKYPNAIDNPFFHLSTRD